MPVGKGPDRVVNRLSIDRIPAARYPRPDALVKFADERRGTTHEKGLTRLRMAAAGSCPRVARAAGGSGVHEESSGRADLAHEPRGLPTVTRRPRRPRSARLHGAVRP